MLTPEQMRTLRFIHDYTIGNRGVPPTFQEIATHLGLKSKSGVGRLTAALEDRGFIRRRRHKARGIEVIRKPPPLPQPPMRLFLERMRAVAVEAILKRHEQSAMGRLPPEAEDDPALKLVLHEECETYRPYATLDANAVIDALVEHAGKEF